MDMVKISYHGHACFTLEYQGYRIVLDPYQNGMVPGLPDLKLEAEAVYCSHQHNDHNYLPAVAICGGEKLDYSVETLIVPHDDANGTKRGMNTIHIFRFGELKIAHLGDIGCRPDEEQLDQLRNLDCVLIPVGGFFTIDAGEAKALLDEIKPRITIPMHYSTDHTGFDLIAHLNEFTKLYDAVNYADNSAVIDKNTNEQILVLNHKP